MTDLLARRGPDSSGCWSDQAGRVHLGFRRLAILDPTPAGNQPMVSHDGRSVVVFNGEIYNFLELKKELEADGVRFRTGTDTEVLLESLNLWGIEVIDRFNGMFAFAWYRLQDRRLFLARDHAGIKPLYYHVHPERRGVAFASQFNVLLHGPWGRPGGVRQDVLSLYMRLHHIPPPYALLEHTHQLEPGHYVQIDEDGSIRKKRWWVMPRDVTPRFDSAADASEALSGVLDAAIRRQRISDVPLGFFLSGGVDSPLVTAVARTQADEGLKAFTIGSPGWGQDESAEASVFAAHLEVVHRLRAVSGEDALAALDDVWEAQHEPFADFSIIPTLLLSRFARSEVTVAMSGDGGDEIFFGYERPMSLLRNGKDFRWPRLVRMALYGAGRYGIGPRRSGAIVHADPGDYYFEVNSRLSQDDLEVLAPGLGGAPKDFDLYRFGRFEGMRDLAGYSRWVEYYGQLQRCLKKVDMASMRHSLEVRVPLLDREVIDVGLQIDPFVSMHGGLRKAILREQLERFVPAHLISKRKRGFAVPLGDWLRGSLKPLVEEVLLDGDLFPGGVFERQAVHSYWQRHLTGERDHKWGIWGLLSLQMWADRHFRPAQGAP